MQVTFNIPDAIVQELNEIARAQSRSNAKQMVIEYLRAELRRSRAATALAGVEAAAEAQADQDTEGIS
jgi:predicted transcriptional regulator